MLSVLKAEMWGTGPETGEKQPREDSERWAMYQEKEAIYKKDLDELPENKHSKKIAEFRKAAFTPDQVARLEKVDEDVARENAKEAEYYSQENGIRLNQGMSAEEKEAAIRDLQDQTFGDGADAFRRRQNMENALKKYGSGKYHAAVSRPISFPRQPSFTPEGSGLGSPWDCRRQTGGRQRLLRLSCCELPPFFPCLIKIPWASPRLWIFFMGGRMPAHCILAKSIMFLAGFVLFIAAH